MCGGGEGGGLRETFKEIFPIAKSICESSLYSIILLKEDPQINCATGNAF